MNKWINARIEKASWRAFAIWFVLWFIYNWWAFNMESPWTRAVAGGGGALPEMQAGFPPTEPQRSLDALAAAGGAGDYIAWQAFDMPYAIGNLFVTSIAMALALKAARLQGSFLRYILILPPLYVLCEIVENALVAAFAAKWIAPAEGLVLVQQAATSVKMLSGFGSMFIAMGALVVALLAAIISRVMERR